MKIKCTFHIAIAFILIQLTDEFSIAFAYGICEKNPYVRILYVTFAILSLLTMIYLYTKYIIRIFIYFLQREHLKKETLHIKKS